MSLGAGRHTRPDVTPAAPPAGAQGRVRMALDAKGQAVFFTRRGRMLASVPPPVNEPNLTPNLPTAPPLGAGQMYNGAARLVDGAVPWAIEAAAREAVEEAMEG